MNIPKISFTGNQQVFKKIGDNLIVDKSMVAAIYHDKFNPDKGPQIILKNANATAMTPVQGMWLMDINKIAQQLDIKNF